MYHRSHVGLPSSGLRPKSAGRTAYEQTPYWSISASVEGLNITGSRPGSASIPNEITESKWRLDSNATQEDAPVIRSRPFSAPVGSRLRKTTSAMLSATSLKTSLGEGQSKSSPSAKPRARLQRSFSAGTSRREVVQSRFPLQFSDLPEVLERMQSLKEEQLELMAKDAAKREQRQSQVQVEKRKDICILKFPTLDPGARLVVKRWSKGWYEHVPVPRKVLPSFSVSALQPPFRPPGACSEEDSLPEPSFASDPPEVQTKVVKQQSKGPRQASRPLEALGQPQRFLLLEDSESLPEDAQNATLLLIPP